jgi:hypothetical protein
VTAPYHDPIDLTSSITRDRNAGTRHNPIPVHDSPSDASPIPAHVPIKVERTSEVLEVGEAVSEVLPTGLQDTKESASEPSTKRVKREGNEDIISDLEERVQELKDAHTIFLAGFEENVYRLRAAVFRSAF